MWIQGLLASIVAAVITLLLVPRVATLAGRLGAVDEPGGRKDHTRPIPRLGGIAIVAGTVLGCLAAALYSPSEALGRLSTGQFMVFLGSLSVIFFLGVLDDLRAVSAPTKFAVQFIAALSLVASGWSFHELRLPLFGNVELGVLAPIVSVLWIVGITNAINLFDGIDGLASGISAIIASSFLVLALMQGHSTTVLVSAALVGACVGFLRHNWAPAKIFMGDSGSLTLGFALAALSLHSALKASTAVAVLVPLLALGLPAIDTLLVMAVRFFESSGHPVLSRVGSMFQADRRHLHHLMLHLAPQRSRIVLWLYGIAALFCAMAVTVAVSRNWTLGMTLLGAQAIAVLLIRHAGFRARAREVSLIERALLKDQLSTAKILQPAPGIKTVSPALARQDG